MRKDLLSATVALVIAAADSAAAEEDGTNGSSVRPPSGAEAGSTVSETSVPPEKRQTHAGPGLPGHSMERVDDGSGPLPKEAAGTQAAADGDAAPASDTATEDQAAMVRAEENEEAVQRYVESIKSREAEGAAADEKE